MNDGSRSWTVIGDVGAWQHYHAGDEAMLAANLQLLRRLDGPAGLRVVSSDPAFSASEYGVAALPRPGFEQCRSDADREALLTHLQQAPQSAPALQQLQGRGDGLVISGGGNLTSAWPACIYERLALCRRAATHGAPIIVVGQTLGPQLTPRHRELVDEILRHAWWIGVREADSFALALALGASPQRLSYQIDDAAFFGTDASLPPLPLAAQQPWIAVTLHPLVDPEGHDPLLDLLAQALTAVAAHSGCRLLFVPHAQAAPASGAPWSDADFGTAIAQRMPPGVMVVLPLQRADVTARLTSQAQAVISSRYHPLVFGLAAGLPCLGISCDDYTRVKLHGALSHYQRGADLTSIAKLRAGLFSTHARTWWDGRAALARDIGALGELHAREEQDRHACLSKLIATAAPSEPPQPRRLAPLLGYAAQRQAAQNASLEQACAEATTRSIELTQQLDRLANRDAATLDAGRHDNGRTRQAKRAPQDRDQHRGGCDMLSEADWQTFWRDGFLHLGQVLDTAQVSALQQRADELALGQRINPAIQLQRDTGGDYDALPDVSAQGNDGTHMYRKIQGLETDELFRALIDTPLFVEICAQVYGRHASISLFRAMIMNKPAGQGTHLPWHQDGGRVWELDRDPLVTIWVALDGATRANGCMEAVRGSHRLGLISQHGSTLSAAAVQEHCRADQVVPLEVPSGHAVLLHNWLIHRSGTNPSPLPRRAFTMCCMDARTRGLLTGAHYPLVYGEAPEETDHFVRQLTLDRDAYREKAGEAEQYALSLREHNEGLNRSIADATRHAQALQAQLGAGGASDQDLQDVREENARLRKANAQWRRETLALNRALDATSAAPAAPAAALDPAQPAGIPPTDLLDWSLVPENVALLRTHAQTLSDQLQAVYASKSWRITRPLRAVLELIERRRH